MCGHLGERSEDVIEPLRSGRDCKPDFGNLERVLDESLFALENGEFVVSGGDCAPSVINGLGHRRIGLANNHPTGIGLAENVGKIGERPRGEPQFNRYGLGGWAWANPELADVGVGVELFRAASSGKTVIDRRVMVGPVRSEDEHRVGNSVGTPARVVRERGMGAIGVMRVIRPNQHGTRGENKGVASELGGQSASAFDTKRDLVTLHRSRVIDVCPITRDVPVKRRIVGRGRSVGISRNGVVTHAASLPLLETMLTV